MQAIVAGAHEQKRLAVKLGWIAAGW